MKILVFLSLLFIVGCGGSDSGSVAETNSDVDTNASSSDNTSATSDENTPPTNLTMPLKV